MRIIDTKKKPNWREELECEVEYKRKFAWHKVTCSDGTKVWFKHYYRKYEHWGETYSVAGLDGDCYRHTDLVELVSEADFIVRRLAEGC